MNRTNHWAAVVAVCCAAAVASAATVTLNGNSSDGFVAKSTWSSGEPPESGNDYVVANGYFLHGDYSQGFAGDSLQFGTVGGTEGIFFKEHKGTHTFTKLILANGYYRTWMSKDGEDGHIAGSVQVTSPESAPFRLHSTHNGGLGWYLTYWDAAITGAEGTGLRVGPYPLNNAHLSKGQTIFTGNNSGYLGSITVYGTNAVFAFTTGNSLGGALSSFKADAFTFCDGTTVESRGTDVTLSSSLNRGVTVDATGGRLHVGGGKALRLEWPVTGTGPLYKVGNGKLTLAAPMSLTAASALTVSNGCIELVSGFSNSGDGGIVVLPECEVTVAAGDEVTVRNLALGGAIRITYDESMATSGVLVLDGSCTPNWPIPVYTPNVREIKVPFLKVPTSIKTVTAADFAKPEDFASTGLPSATFTVETASGIQTVYAEMSKLVTVSNTYNGAANPKAHLKYEPGRWSDNKYPHSKADYQVGAGKTLYAQDVSGAYTFPGDSLSFSGASGGLASFDFYSSGITSFTADLRTYNYAKIYAKGNSEVHLGGRLYVGGNQASDNSLDFRASVGGLTVVIDSVVSGSGQMSFQPGANNRTNTYCFTAQDNAFAGTYFLYGGKPGALTTLEFANSGSWGKNPSEYKEKGLLLQGSASAKVELHPIGSQTIAHSNRAFYFINGESRLRVDAGEVFDLQSPMTFQNSSIGRKIGGGTWAVGGSVSISGAGTPQVAVEEGYLRADNPRAFLKVNVTVSEGAGIAAKYRPGDTSEVATYGMIVTNSAGFAVSGDTLKFKVATGGEKVRTSERVAILTVPEETATALGAKAIRIEHDDAYARYAILERENVTVLSTPCVRYSCRFIKGTKIILR